MTRIMGIRSISRRRSREFLQQKTGSMIGQNARDRGCHKGEDKKAEKAGVAYET